MYFDWITWSIWSMGFIILIMWIIVPLKEFLKLKKDRAEES
jgi:hypothetical protein